MRTNVTFTHPAPFVPLSNDEGIVAAGSVDWFLSIIRSRASLKVDPEVCQEDWGVVLFVELGGKKFWIGLSTWPEAENGWLAHIHHGSFAWIQRFQPKGKEALAALLNGLHQALSSDPAVSQIEWYTEAQMMSGKTELPATEP